MKHVLGVALVLFLLAGVLFAQDSGKMKELEERIKILEDKISALQNEKPESADMQEMQRELKILAEEIEKLRTGETEEVKLDDAARRSLGLGPSASSVYTRKQGVSLAGYGEMLYQNFDGKTDAGSQASKFDQIDLLRAVVYFGYRFNDRFLFNSELEFEHATTGEGDEERGEASVEFATIDFRATDHVTLRGGLILVPMGFINEFHEPNVFLGARRPLTETFIIPSTWRENGFGIAGRSGIVDYRAFVINGLNSAEFSSSGISEGRQEGSQAKINPAIVVRADVTPVPGFMAGGSFYVGNSEFFAETFVPDTEFQTTVSEMHAEWKRRGLELRALYAKGTVANAGKLNDLLELEGNSSVGSSMVGGYLQAGYTVMTGGSKQYSVTPYFRIEKVNPQHEVPAGFAKDRQREITAWTFGAEFKPITNIVIKADYQNFDSASDTAIDQFNIALGYSF